MDENSAKKRIEELRREVALHEELYRVKNAPVISDDEFDLLMRELRALEAEFPQFADPNSPSANVGNDLSEAFEGVPHLSPMLSLDNVFNSAELEEFDARLRKVLELDAPLTYCVEPKIDGAGISAVYENGKLARLLTRGDGEKGDDITRNAVVVKNLPLKLSGKKIPTLLEIRGEAYMTVEEFERIKKEISEEEPKNSAERKLRRLKKSIDAIEGAARQENLLKAQSDAVAKLKPEERAAIEKYLAGSPRNPLDILDEKDFVKIEKLIPANPRNLAAGTMKLLDKETLRSRSLMAIFYSIGKMDGFEIAKQSELPRVLESWGLPAVNWFETAEGAGGAFESISRLEEIREDFPFNTDGAVVKLDDCSLHEKAGLTSHAPRWATAWKYRAERAQTRLNSISVQVGRTGVVTPVAELEPVWISGSTVSRATLHNAGHIAEKDIREGDTVIVEKAGEIIPAVIGPVLDARPKDSKPFEFPTHCPECGSPLKRFGEKMLHRCPNFSCPPQVRGRLGHFASRGCMDIHGLGEKAVEKLVSDLGVRDPSDIYRLSREQLLTLEKFKDKSADNLLASIEESKKRDLWRLIFALGILEIGEQFAKDLAAHFGTLDAVMNADIEQIKSLEGFGSKSPKKKKDGGEPEQPVRALSVRVFFDDQHNRELVEKLRACGLNFKAEKISAAADNPFSGKLFVLTGSLKSMTRDAAKAVIEKFGGRTGSSVTSSTDILISEGETDSAKMRDAKSLGKKIIGEDEFLKMISEAEGGAPAKSAFAAQKKSDNHNQTEFSF